MNPAGLTPARPSLPLRSSKMMQRLSAEEYCLRVLLRISRSVDSVQLSLIVSHVFGVHFTPECLLTFNYVLLRKV